MLMVAWHSVQQIATPSTDRCSPSRPSEAAPVTRPIDTITDRLSEVTQRSEK
jgi:hypothetical protein